MISSTHEETKNKSKGLDKECSDKENKRKIPKTFICEKSSQWTFYYKALRDKC